MALFPKFLMDNTDIEMFNGESALWFLWHGDISVQNSSMFVCSSLCSGGTVKSYFKVHNSAIVQRRCTISKQLSCYPVTLQDVGHERDIARRHYACETLPQRVRVHPRPWKAPSPVVVVWFVEWVVGVRSWARLLGCVGARRMMQRKKNRGQKKGVGIQSSTWASNLSNLSLLNVHPDDRQWGCGVSVERQKRM